ncbi:MAG: hypothetical protein QXF20_03540 [Candidatus Hadarchaeales archaeon]
MRIAREVFHTWKEVILHPERVKEGFSLGFMIAVSFYLGFLYNTFHFFLYPVYTVEEFHAGLFFWLHSLFGGAAAAGTLLYVSAIGYFGCLLLGKRISYSKIEHLVFACSFLWLLPLLFSLVLIAMGVEEPPGKVKEMRLFGDWFYVTWAVLLSAPIASFLTFRIFRRAFGFDTFHSLPPALLILPLGYIVGKGSFMLVFREWLDLEEKWRMIAGIFYFSAAGWVFYQIRERKEKIEDMFWRVLRRFWPQSSRSQGVGRQERKLR